MNDCPNTAEDEKRKLVIEYLKKKKAKPKVNHGSVGAIDDGKRPENTSLFEGSFADGKLKQ